MCGQSFSALDEFDDVFGNAFGGEKGHCVIEVTTIEVTRGILRIFQNDVVNVGWSRVLVESPIGHPVDPVRGRVAVRHLTEILAISLDISLHLAEAVEQGSPDPRLLGGGSIGIPNLITEVIGGEYVGGCCISHASIVP